MDNDLVASAISVKTGNDTNYCHKTESNYGSIRAMGSLGFMLASIAVGFLADKFGLDGPLFASYACLLVIAFPISFTFPKDAKAVVVALLILLRTKRFDNIDVNKGNIT